MRRRWPLALRASCTVLAIATAVLVAVVLLTDPNPAGLLSSPGRLLALVPRWGGPKSTQPPMVTERPVALFSDDWFDDSGFSFTTAYTGPVDDPTSLEQLRASL